MKRKQWLYTSILAVLLTTFFPSPTLAQVGFGFGWGSFGGWGPGFYGGGWGPGAWLNVWPHWNRGSQNQTIPQQPQYYQPNYYQPAPQPTASTGVLEGKIQVASNCPAQPQKVCPVSTQPMNDVTVTATPADSSQWVTAQPDEQGNYRLLLPPGNYQVKAQNAYSKAETSQSVTVQSGESTHLDMGLYSELY